MLSWSTEKRTCDAKGRFTCLGYDEWTDTQPVHAAPFVQSVLLIGRRKGLRVGPGLRYVPPGLLDTGSELHFAIVPEVIGSIAPSYSLSAGFFNSFVLGLGAHDFEQQQDALIRDCEESAAFESASCSAHRSRLGLALELDVGVIQHLQGGNVRYQIGFQSNVESNFAYGTVYTGPYDDPTDSRYTGFSVSGTRLVATIGFER